MLKGKKSRPPVLTEAEGYNSSDVARICGVSLRQLQWWDERNVVSPRQDGHKRIYSKEEVVEISVIAELRRKGFSLQKIRRVIRFVQKELGKRLVETVTAASEYHLLTDGWHIFLQDSARGVVDLLKNARQPMLTVCLSDTIQRILPRPGRRGPGLAGKDANAVTQKKRNGSVRHLTVRRRRA